MNVKYIDCACKSPDHVIRLGKFDDEDEAWLEVQLPSYHNVFKRIWMAIKYVFGYKCRYGYWDCFIIHKEEAEQIREFLREL